MDNNKIYNISSNYILKLIFSNLKYKQLLKIIKYTFIRPE